MGGAQFDGVPEQAPMQQPIEQQPQQTELPMDGGNNGDVSDGSDGKSEIQQMAGELSQKIRDYNSALQEPDAETNKFAAGMVVSAAIKDLSDDDRKDIVKKLKAGEFDDNASDDVAAQEETEMTEDMPVECTKYTKKQIREDVENSSEDIVDIFERNGWVFYDFFDKTMDGDTYTCFVLGDDNATCTIDELVDQVKKSYEKVKIGTRANKYAPEQKKKYIIGIVEDNTEI